MLSKEEVKAILEALSNPKHKAMGKGRKDRIAPLPERIVEMLRAYYKAYRPKEWLFEGQEVGTQYSPTSLQEVLKTAQ